MTSPYPRTQLFAAVAAFALCASSAVRADEPPPAAPTPAPGMPERSPEKTPTRPAVEAGVVFEEGTPKWDDVLAKAKAAGKPIFIDFFTDWCGWCKKLDADTYPVPSVGKVMEALVNLRVDAEKGEGVDLAKRFGARGFPTLVVVGTDDQEIDRIVGYLAPEPFAKEMSRILSGEGTLPTLRKAADANPNDLKAAFALLKKLLAANALDGTTGLEALGEKAKGKDRDVEAGVLVALAQNDLGTGKLDDATAKVDRVALEFGDTESGKDAVRMALGLRMRGRNADPEAALAFAAKLRGAIKDGKLDGATEQTIASLHLRAAEKAFERAAADAGDDAQKLNALAWTCFERRVAIEAAIGWARTAVEKSGRDIQILDTLACLLSVQRKYDDALALEFEAFGKLGPADDRMRTDFQRNISNWVRERDEMKADRAVPATKLVPAKAKPSK